jgi:hypothetical protein
MTGVFFHWAALATYSSLASLLNGKGQRRLTLASIWPRRTVARRKLRRDREQDQHQSRLLIKQSHDDTSDEPAAAIPSIIQSEGEIAFVVGKEAGDSALCKLSWVAQPIPRSTNPPLGFIGNSFEKGAIS